jgi:hypothetical protein
VIERAAALEEAERQLKEAKASIPKAQLKVFKQSGVGKYINPKAFTNKYIFNFLLNKIVSLQLIILFFL